MKATINNTLISNLKPKNKPYEVRDDKVIGFLVRVNISGKLLYMCEFARGKRVTIGKVGVLTPAQARDHAREILADAIKGIDPRTSKKDSSAYTLYNFIEKDYAPWVLANRKDGVRTLARIKRCFYKLLDKKELNQITPVLIDQWRTQRMKDGKKPDTVNRDIATFKAALSKAVLWGFIEKNPLGNLSLLKVDHSPKVRYLNKDEEIRLRSALELRQENIRQARASANKWRMERSYDPLPDFNDNLIDYIKPMVILSLNTGMRQGEIFNLKWRDIDFDKKILSVSGEYAKSSKTRHIPLNDEAFKVLLQWKEITLIKQLVFESKEGNKFNNVRKSWLTVLKLADIQNFRWHDMRHHFASKLVMCGVDLNTVRELLGHSDLKMTLRYAHLAPEHKAQAVAKLLSISAY
jgi:integrase